MQKDFLSCCDLYIIFCIILSYSHQNLEGFSVSLASVSSFSSLPEGKHHSSPGTGNNGGLGMHQNLHTDRAQTPPSQSLQPSLTFCKKAGGQCHASDLANVYAVYRRGWVTAICACPRRTAWCCTAVMVAFMGNALCVVLILSKAVKHMESHPILGLQLHFHPFLHFGGVPLDGVGPAQLLQLRAAKRSESGPSLGPLPRIPLMIQWLNEYSTRMYQY